VSNARIRGARVHTDPRFSRRRRTIARSRRRALVARLAAVLTVAALVWAAFWSPLLQVRAIKVTGAEHTSVRQIAEVAGVSEGHNLLLLSTGEIARRTETLPWVRRAAVDRKLPGTVRVRIVEREPALTLSVGPRRWTLDAAGRVLQEGAAPGARPVLAGIEVAHVAPGARLRSPEARGALAALRSMPRALRSRVSAVFAPTAERISLSLDTGVLVRYGAAERLDAKNSVLVAVLRRLASTGGAAATAYVDVRVPASPAVGARLPASPGPSERPGQDKGSG
jgi:cell division protein FtsQ